jgi:hypothetical protein
MMMMMRTTSLTMVRQRPYNRNTVNVESKSKCDTGNNSGNWNHLKIIQNLAEKHNRNALNQGNAKKAMFWYCVYASGCANKKYRMLNMGNNITHTTNCNYRIDVTLCTILTSFVPGIQLWILYIKSDNRRWWWWWWWCTSRMRSYSLREKVLLHQLGSWSVFFNDPINCYDVTASAIDKWMSMEQWWNDNGQGNKRTIRKIYPSSIFVHHTTHMEWSGFESLAV